jgi:hypothetical protein
MQASAPGELLPVIIIPAEQPPRDALDAAACARPKSVRRTAVVSVLKEASARSQHSLLEWLAIQRRDGLADGTGGGLADQRHGGLVADRVVSLWLNNVIAARVTPAIIEHLAGRPDVAAVRLDVEIPPPELPVDGLRRGKIPGDRAQPSAGESHSGREVTCGLDLVRAPQVWDEHGITGRGTVVCVIDSGCCITHPDLRSQIWVNEAEVPGNGIDDDANGYIDDINGWSFADGGSNNIHDVDGHGTHVAGTVAGDGTSGLNTGVAPDAALMICRYAPGESFESSVWEAIQYAVDNGAHAITGSIGLLHNRGPDRAGWRVACDNAIAAGVVVLFAAGNAGQRFPPYDSVATPADVPDVIAVGATDCSGFWIKFSSVGPTTWQDVDPFHDWPYPPGRIKPDIAAPGNDVRSTGLCSGYTTMSGTSMATPHVTGAVALILEADPTLDHSGVRRILEETADPKGGDPDNFVGAGVLDAFAAVEQAIAERGCPRDPALICDGDVDGNGAVNPVDVGLVQAAFCAPGNCTKDAICQYDLDCNGAINPVDAGLVQSLFGGCEEPRRECP